MKILAGCNGSDVGGRALFLARLYGKVCRAALKHTTNLKSLLSVYPL